MAHTQRPTGPRATGHPPAGRAAPRRTAMRRLLRGTVLSATAAGLLAVAPPASATHSHVIQTPGTCVDKAGAGFGTGEDHAHPSFHSQVHKGTPGLFAFERRNNPVSVVAGTCP